MNDHVRTTGSRGWRELASLVLLLPTAVLLGTQAVTPASGSEVCPGERMTPPGDTTAAFTYTAPDGYLVDGWCVENGPTVEFHDAADGDGHELPAASVTIEPATGSSQSYYSVVLVPVETPDSTPPEGTPSTSTPPDTTPSTSTPSTSTPSTSTPSVSSPPEVLPSQAFGKALGAVRATCQGTVRTRLDNASGERVTYTLRVGGKAHRITVRSQSAKRFVTHGRARAVVTLSIGSARLDRARIPARCEAPELLPETGLRATSS